MKYFLHDTNAHQDEKIMELCDRYGYEGTGLFYAALERFGYSESPIKTRLLKKQLGVGRKLEKCWQFMEEIGLISTVNGESFNEKLMDYSKKYQIQKEKNRERVVRHRALSAEKEGVKENVTHYVTDMKRLSNASKVNINESKENGYIEAMPTLSLFDNIVTDTEDIKPEPTANKSKSSPKSQFVKPAQQEIVDFLESKDVPSPEQEAEIMYCYYQSVDWKIGSKPMKDWRMAISGWVARERKKGNMLPKASTGGKISFSDYSPSGTAAPSRKMRL